MNRLNRLMNRFVTRTVLARALVLSALVAGLLMPGSDRADAADLRLQPRMSKSRVFEPVSPFPRSERSQSVWASNACWTECGSFTAWGEAACLQYDTQGTCLQRADSADRSCQRQCRTSGGPLLPLDF